MKKRDRLSSVLTNMFAAAALTMASLPASASDAENKPSSDPIFVESHDILLLDLSGSMAEADIQVLFQGAAEYYLSEEAMLDYRSGICTASTVIYYGKIAATQKTEILCSEESVQNFVRTYVMGLDLDAARKNVDYSETNLLPALIEAANLIKSEKTVLDIEASRHRIVVAGDELGGMSDSISGISRVLSEELGATVSAVAIGKPWLSERFKEDLVTPPGAKYITYERGVERRRPLAAGMAYAALDSQQVKSAFETVFTLGGY